MSPITGNRGAQAIVAVGAAIVAEDGKLAFENHDVQTGIVSGDLPQTDPHQAGALFSTGQLPAPAAPVPTTAGTGGTVAAGVYTVEVSYTNALGESVASAAGTVTTSGSTSTLTVPSPSASTGATGWYAYVSQAGGSTLTRQQAAGSPTAIGTPLVLTAPPTSTGAAPPTTNNSGAISISQG